MPGHGKKLSIKWLVSVNSELILRPAFLAENTKIVKISLQEISNLLIYARKDLKRRRHGKSCNAGTH